MSWGSLDSILDDLDGKNKPGYVDPVIRDTNSIVPVLPKKEKSGGFITSKVQHINVAPAERADSARRPSMRKKNKIFPQMGDGPPSQEDIELQKLVERGVDLTDVDTDEQQWEVIENIRAIPCPMRVKFILRDKLLSGEHKSVSSFVTWKHGVSRSWKRFKQRTNEVGQTIEFWGKSFKSIEGHHGTGVLSYFVLLRWLLGLNFVLFALMFGFVSIPQMLQPTVDYSGYSTDAKVNLSYHCSPQYQVNVSTDAAQLLLDFFQGTGFLEQTMAFYGHYWGVQFLKGSSQSTPFVYNVPLAYFLVSAVCLVLSLFLMARHTAGSFRESILDSRVDAGFEFCNKVFGSWDYTMSDESAACLKHNSIYYDIACDLAEERFLKERAERMSVGHKKCMLYTVRFFINFFVLCCLGGGGYLIYYVTIFSTSYAADNSEATGDAAIVLLLVNFLPSLTITALNGGLPVIFGIVVKAEDYTQAFIVKITLIRTVFLRLASLAVLVVSLYTEISCQPKDSCLASQEPCTVMRCWETYVGQQMYKLIILNFLVTVVKVFLVEFPRKLVVSKCKAKLFQKIGPPEFQIPQNVLDLVYTQTVCWIGFYFSPLIPAMVVIHLFIVFYCKKLSALFACEPSQRPYRAARSNSFFMIVLLLAFFLCCVPVCYSMSELGPSKGCGPFRIYDKAYEVLEESVTQWPGVLFSIYKILTSSAVVAALLVLLLLLVYYCNAMKNAHTDMNKMLKHQLTMEGQDVRFLTARIQELTGEKNPLTKSSRRKSISLIGSSNNTANGRPPQKGSTPLQNGLSNGGTKTPLSSRAGNSRQASSDGRTDIENPPPPQPHQPMDDW